VELNNIVHPGGLSVQTPAKSVYAELQALHEVHVVVKIPAVQPVGVILDGAVVEQVSAVLLQ